MQRIELVTPRHGRVAACRFDPPDQARPRMQVVIGPAMGMYQRDYAAFAVWLARQGVRVLTFDYRGHGDSLALLQVPSLRRVDATLDDWRADYEAATQHLHAQAPELPLLLIGHSMGAQLPGLFGQNGHIDGLLAVAAGSGYWRDNRPMVKIRALFLWHTLVPLITALLGCFPGRRLGIVDDLPAGVVRQWRRWCLHPNYSGAEGVAARQRYAQVHFPIHALWIDDDEIIQPSATENLLALYANAPRQIDNVVPAEHGADRIGHLGWFDARFESTLWPGILPVLRRLVAEGRHDA